MVVRPGYMPVVRDLCRSASFDKFHGGGVVDEVDIHGTGKTHSAGPGVARRIH